MVPSTQRDLKSLPNLQICRQESGAFGFWFGETELLADVEFIDKAWKLRGRCGNQVAYGEWRDLDETEIAEICVEIEKELAKNSALAKTLEEGSVTNGYDRR